jgi:hypothetical protein
MRWHGGQVSTKPGEQQIAGGETVLELGSVLDEEALQLFVDS